MEEKLGSKYTEGRAVEFSKSYEESGPAIPVFFILSPGVDPLKDVEALGKKLGFTDDNRNFHNISLGQGQEVVAEQAMELGAKEGHWVVLQVRGVRAHRRRSCSSSACLNSSLPSTLSSSSSFSCWSVSFVIFFFCLFVLCFLFVFVFHISFVSFFFFFFGVRLTGC